MNWLTKAYFWCWYHIESLWIEDKWLRRPFTYLFRDFLHQHLIIGIIIRLAIVTGVILLTRWNYWGVLVGMLYAFILGHIDWSGYKPNEQEDPPYIPDKSTD
jgi:hypothetical protein